MAWADGLGEVIWDIGLQTWPWILLFSACGFIGGLIFSIYLARKRLLKRKHPLWNALAKFSYVLILLAMPLGLGGVGAIYSMQHTINRGLDEQLLPAVTEQMPALARHLDQQLKRFPTGKIVSVRDLVEPLVKDLYYVPTSDGLWERSKARLINDMILSWGAKTLTEAVQRALLAKLEVAGQVLQDSRMTEKASSDELVRVGGSAIIKFMTDTTKEIDFTQLEETLPSMLVDALKSNFNHSFKSIYVTIFLPMLGMLLLIVVEILYYRRHLRKLAEKNTLPSASKIVSIEN
jgi:hypothetical protein